MMPAVVSGGRMVDVHHHGKLPRFVRIMRARPRLFVCALIGLAVIAALPGELRTPTRLLIGWDVGVALYLAAALAGMARADISRIRRNAATQDEGQAMMLIGITAAAVASLAAIVAELGSGHRGPQHLVLATTTILLSWGFIHTFFALHYAHEYYGERAKQTGLAFPGTDHPDYWDFMYFALIIGMTSQVSDVAIASQRIRRTATAHGLVAFFFNAALLALMVNIAASAL